MSYLAFVVLTLLLALAGCALPARRWTVRWMAGALLFHLLLTAYDAAGIRWSRLALLLPLAVLAALGLRRKMEPARLPSDLGWGDGAALFALAAFALFAPTLWITTPDFVYHWGIKGERFFLTGGVDYAWLAKDWNWVLHPDYPNLLPELFAGTAILAGRFEAPAQMLWSALVFGLLLGASREALRRAEAPRSLLQPGLASIAFALAAFGLGHRMAGAADWMPALSLAVALPALLRPPDREGDIEVGMAAAFAAASKIEGVPLAALLAGVQLLRGRIDLRRALWLGLPTVLVTVPWAVQTFRQGLYQKFNTGTLDPGRAPMVFHALVAATVGENWHGLPAVLLILPFLLLVRHTRPAAMVVSLQLLFYLWIYFSAAVDTEYQVLSSFPRLALHLFPSVVVLAIMLPTIGQSTRPSDNLAVATGHRAPKETLMRVRHRLTAVLLLLLLALPVLAHEQKASLYQRLGGYDAIAAVADEFLSRLLQDPKMARFFAGFSTDSKQRIRQHLIEQLCAGTGGPCVYTGRDMKTAHAGIGITEEEWNAGVGHLVGTLDKLKVGQKEKDELLALVGSLKGDIVEKK